MTSIAITVVGFNEAGQLPTVFESARWADQIVYVDCESSDDSVAVAKRYTDHVYPHTNHALIIDKRAFAFEKAQTEWILYLDPDEVVPPALAEEIRRVIGGNPPENGFSLPRRNFYFGHWLRHGRQYPDTQLRLFRKGKAAFPRVYLNARLQVEGRVGQLSVPMDHHTSATVLESIDKMGFYTTIHAREMARQGVRPTFRVALDYMVVKPGWRFVRRYVLKGGWRDGWPGFVQACIGSIEYQFRFLKFWHFANHPEETGSTSPFGEPTP